MVRAKYGYRTTWVGGRTMQAMLLPIGRNDSSRCLQSRGVCAAGCLQYFVQVGDRQNHVGTSVTMLLWVIKHHLMLFWM